MVDPLRDTPREVIEALIRWGGKNEYGEPNWRIILAQNHLVQRAGMWTEFADDTEQTQFRTVGSQVRYQHRDIAPDRILTGTRWVPLYQIEGWILERWFPASSYGSREQWESALSQDGVTPMMGPFPERGGYFMPSGGGPWEEIPVLEDIRASIAQWENSSHLHGFMDAESVNNAMRRAQIEADDEEERKYDKFLQEVAYQRLTHLEFIKSNPALAGFRNRLANSKGLMSQV
jgi:hypothetical protein